MAAMGFVMTVAAMAFKTVVYEHMFAESHLTAEQQARLAMAKISGISRQASVVDSSPQPNASQTPAIIEPFSTPGPRLVFTQVACLGTDATNCLPVVNGVPQPCYNIVKLYVVRDVLPSTGASLWEQADPVGAAPGGCPGFDYSHMPLLIARNVEDFQVAPIANSVDLYATGYRVDLTIYGYDDNKIDTRAGAAYHLQSVITPIVFGAAR
jgi:hypothetical protein